MTAENKCQTCGKTIEKVPCRTHEEIYEIGHDDDCPYKQNVKEGCVIEEN